MKRIAFALSLLGYVYILSAQSWISSSQISSVFDLQETASVIDNDGIIYTFGTFEGTMILPNGDEITSFGGNDYYLIKFLPDGSVDWASNFGNPDIEGGSGGLDIDANGDIYITGAFQNVMSYGTGTLTSTGMLDIFLIKIHSNGTVDWAENIGQGPFLQYPTTLEIDNSGDILVGGSFMSSILFNESLTLYAVPMKFDAFYAKFSPTNGELTWAKQVRSLKGKQVSIFDIESNENSYLLNGTYTDTLAFETDTVTSEYSKLNTFLFRTDLSGNIDWHRKIEGSNAIYGFYQVMDDEDNIYLTSHYDSASIYVETSENNFLEVDENKGNQDIYVVKYTSSGTMDWFRSIGGKENDRVYGIEFFDDKIWTAGYISDTVQWGGIELAPSATSGQDMFVGAFTKDGNPRSANIYRGEGHDESRAIFQNGDQLYTVMRSTSDNLIIGDSIYDSNEGKYYIVLGVLGCLPISVDNTIYNDVETCFGDSTGSIQISSTGGFGGPWVYSIDNGSSSSETAFFSNLPSGDYQIVVVDGEGCATTGPLVTLTQPDTLEVEVVSSEDITGDHDGSIVVVARGGSAPYTYMLQPDGALQAIGTFTFVSGDSGTYVVGVNDLNGCGPALTDSITISEIPDGIEDAFGLNVKVYPNPTSGNVTIEMPFEGAQADMEVLNMTGQLVLKRRVFSNGGVLNESLDLSDQAKGLYMLRVNGVTLRSAIMVK